MTVTTLGRGAFRVPWGGLEALPVAGRRARQGWPLADACSLRPASVQHPPCFRPASGPDTGLDGGESPPWLHRPIGQSGPDPISSPSIEGRGGVCQLPHYPPRAP
jgi:hypothetical protein